MSAAPLLRMRGVEKRYGAVVALAGVDLEIETDEVHALVGENGAGKSTLMKVLSGAVAPDAGRMELGGAAFAPAGPLDARQSGVAMIYQELNLAPHLSVEDNVMLGREERRFGIVRREAARPRVREALALLGRDDIDPEQRVLALGPGARQVVEIAKALVGDARVVVMDEPTSSLSHADAERLFDAIRRLKERGVSVIYISHFLEEVMKIADRYTVLRDGRTVGSGDVASASPASLIERMVGRAVDEIFPRVQHEIGEPVLELWDLAGVPAPTSASLTLHRGEILGIAGLVGAGRTEMLRATFGLDPIRRGHVKVAGVADHGRSPHERLGQGVALLSEDRKQEGLALGMSIAENVTLSKLAPYARWGLLDRHARDARAAALAAEVGIKCRDVAQRAGELSGGNQQKVAIARLLHHEADVLMLDEPTRGVDVGSKAEIYALVGELAARGKAILFVSSYVPELLGVCDRIAVMHRGVLGSARAASEWTERDILDEATRGESAE